MTNETLEKMTDLADRAEVRLAEAVDHCLIIMRIVNKEAEQALREIGGLITEGDVTSNEQYQRMCRIAAEAYTALAMLKNAECHFELDGEAK